MLNKVYWLILVCDKKSDKKGFRSKKKQSESVTQKIWKGKIKDKTNEDEAKYELMSVNDVVNL